MYPLPLRCHQQQKEDGRTDGHQCEGNLQEAVLQQDLVTTMMVEEEGQPADDDRQSNQQICTGQVSDDQVDVRAKPLKT